MKEACPSKWSQSGEMSSEDTAAAFSDQPSLIAAYSSEPSSPVPARDRKAGTFTSPTLPPLPLLGKINPSC